MIRPIPLLLPALLLTLVGVASGFEWEDVPPATQGLDGALLDALTPRIDSGELGEIQGVMVIRGGQVVYREHFRGYAGEPLRVFSVTKSVGSILLGTLERRGLLDVNTALNDHFPTYPQARLDPLRRQITVQHVLQQRHGYDWDEWPYTGAPDHPIPVMTRSPDWFRTVLTWPMAGPPGQEFRYSTGASGLMSGIVTNATGKTVQTYAREALFDPLGIGAVDWALDDLNQPGGILDEDDFPEGNAPLGFGLWMTLPDLARIGQMMLDGGTWEGQQIIREGWLEDSIRPWSNSLTDPEVFTAPGFGYGYQWWVLPITDAFGRTFDAYYALGYGRQYILIFPQADLVVVQLAEDFQYEGPGIGVGLREHILPAMTTDPREFEPMRARLNGSWFDPEVPGQGLNVEVLEERNEALVYWYTYDEAGSQRWLIGQGPIDEAGVAHLEFLVTSGGRPALPTTPDLVSWGTAELSFDSCMSGRLLFTADGLEGEVPLTRLTGAGACADAKVSHGIP